MKQIENTWHKHQHTKRNGVFDKGCQHKDKKSQMHQHKYKEDVKEKSKERSHEANPILGVHTWGYIGEFEPL
jgi:hypothetical protein